MLDVDKTFKIGKKVKQEAKRHQQQQCEKDTYGMIEFLVVAMIFMGFMLYSQSKTSQLFIVIHIVSTVCLVISIIGLIIQNVLCIKAYGKLHHK